MLLYEVRSPTSFCHLRVVNGFEHHTFKEACEARGLLQSDSEHDRCLNEAAFFKSAAALRRLFITIIIFNEPTNPRSLFDRHESNMAEDIPYMLTRFHQIPHPTDSHVRTCLLEKLEEIAMSFSKTLQALSLPTVPAEGHVQLSIARVFAGELSWDQQQLQRDYEHMLTLANQDQQTSIAAITTAVDTGTGELFFLDGPGGTGKTFVEEACLANV